MRISMYKTHRNRKAVPPANLQESTTQSNPIHVQKKEFFMLKLLCLDDEAEFAVAIVYAVFLHRLCHPTVDAT